MDNIYYTYIIMTIELHSLYNISIDILWLFSLTKDTPNWLIKWKVPNYRFSHSDLSKVDLDRTEVQDIFS